MFQYVSNALKVTMHDLNLGFNRREMWVQFGWNDIRKKYRRSAIGPLWASLNTGIFVLFLGFMYSELFNRNLDEYLPHLLVGWLVWNFISLAIKEACLAATENRSLHI